MRRVCDAAMRKPSARLHRCHRSRRAARGEHRALRRWCRLAGSAVCAPAPGRLGGLQIEISLLSPPAPIDPAEIEIGRHGLLVSCGTQRGLAPAASRSRAQFYPRAVSRRSLPESAVASGSVAGVQTPRCSRSRARFSPTERKADLRKRKTRAGSCRRGSVERLSFKNYSISA